MTTRRRKFEFQLQDRSMGSDLAGPSITTSGGKCIVTGAGSPLKAAITDVDGTALTNPITLSGGRGSFYTLDTVDSVDLFIQTGDGQAVQLFSVKADGVQLIPVDRGRRDQVMVIPMHITDYPATVETATGFVEPTGAIFTADAAGVKVSAIDATETLDVGTLSSDTGDADGFISAIDIGTLGYVVDNGALFSSGAPHVGAGKSITMTTTAGSDTGQVYVFLPYTLFTTGAPTP